jgi:hypothetical protein
MFEKLLRPDTILIVVPVVMFSIVLEMVRRRRLREDYSLLWLGTFGVLVVLAIFRDMLLEPLARMMGIFDPRIALFVIWFGMLLLISLQFSAVLTKLALENKQAAQHIALLTARVRELEHKLEDRADEPDGKPDAL